MKIVAIEGIDCSGKETQAKLLVRALSKKGYSVVGYAFPRYETEIGGLIGRYLRSEINLTQEAFHMLYAADRLDFMRVIKWLEDIGMDYLICDRFTMSNLAFGRAKGFDVEWLESLEVEVRKPDITFLLDIPVSVSAARKQGGRDRYEGDFSLLRGVKDAYQTLAAVCKLSGYSILKVDGTQPENKVHQVILDYTMEHTQTKG